ncbi:MAG: SDR family oxidoreductase [Acidobacteriota bacterium]|nr:MAG: SDR family oxidoreductase [Acidobacteriota bacterium]
MSVVDRQNQAGSQSPATVPTPNVRYWRVEGSLLNLSAVRPVGYFTWHSQSFSERWKRRGGLALLAVIRPLMYAVDRIFATRVLHTLLRGISRDRLDLLGEEYFQYILNPRLKPKGVSMLREALARGEKIVLVSQGLEHVMRPLARHLGVEYLIANRLEFRDGLATGRLLTPVIRPRQVLARIVGRNPDGHIEFDNLARRLGLSDSPQLILKSIIPTHRETWRPQTPIVIFDKRISTEPLSVIDSLAGKNILLIGFTGFIGKVWLAKILQDLPRIGKIYLLIRRQRSTTARKRFEKIIETSPVFDALNAKYGDDFAGFLADKVEVIEGDVSRQFLGIEPEVRERLLSSLDVIINSSGLTDFNPDLRQALAINVDGTLHLIEFLRTCSHAALLHLSTCYVVGYRDGRIGETAVLNYTPNGTPGFSAEAEYRHLRSLADRIEARGDSEEMTAQFRQSVLKKSRQSKKELSESEIEAQIRKQRQRWVRDELTEAGMRRGQEFGWPNTYTFTKSIAESLLLPAAAEFPIAIVRPSIVETSTHDPFEGWNEGVNTSAPLSYLLGTFFRQLPSNGRKCLDIIPVDLVCRGMVLIAAALVRRRHETLYQLATSAINPCDMRRSIELTGLAHRKYYRAQDDFNLRLLSLFDSIPVSKERYQRLSAPRQKLVVQSLLRIMSPLPMMRSPLVRRERDLDKVEKLVQLYEPFILHNDYIFEAKNVEILSELLPAGERATFGYDAGYIDWWDYWINVHIPALRKWSYPIIEGRPIDNPTRRNLQIPAQHVATN